MEITDYTEEFDMHTCNKHSILFPKNIFCVIAGSMGSGKTNLMLNLLQKEKLLSYDPVYVYSSTLYQPAYEYLETIIENWKSLFYKQSMEMLKLRIFLMLVMKFWIPQV